MRFGTLCRFVVGLGAAAGMVGCQHTERRGCHSASVEWVRVEPAAVAPPKGKEALPGETPAHLPARASDDTEKFPRRSFGDITARACFGHAEDHSWLSGQLQHGRGDGAWRLRYAAVDDEDTLGGTVTLTGTGMEHFKNGELVRVTGHVVDTEAGGGAVTYAVTDIQRLPSLP